MHDATYTDPTRTRVDVAVIGGGQAGLAASAELARRDVDHVVLDASPRTGHSWRTRWDSLRLFTPAAYSSLPGMAFPAPAWHHPTKDEVADYLEGYAAHFDLPVRHRAAVRRVTGEAGAFELDTPTGTVDAARVVLATGPFQTPSIPALAGQLPAEVLQLHSSGYRNPAQIPAGSRVLVVGAGNSGVQIAVELGRTHDVHLAVGSECRHVPQRVLGRDLFWWLTRTGMLTASRDSRRGRRMARTEMVIGTSREDLDRAGVVLRPRVTSVGGSGPARFEDGSELGVDAVVWATGFRADHRVIEVPGALDEHGRIRQQAGVGAVDGLFTVGQPWQTHRGSALLGFVGADADAIAERIASGRTAPRQHTTAR